MDDEHKNIIIRSIGEGFALKEKYSDYAINANFQLLITQLDLFKTISTIVVAIVGIGYFLNDQLSPSFLTVSFIFSLLTILGTISYSREIIDLEAKQIKNYGVLFNKKIDESINIAVEAIKKKDSKIYFSYAEQEIKDRVTGDKLIYAGEIFTFCFYLSITFGILAFFSYKYNFGLFSWITILVIIFTYIISFKNWSHKIINFFSTEINLFEKILKPKEH